MKKSFPLLLLCLTTAAISLAAAKYKPPFYDRTIISIYTPVLGAAEQKPLPLPVLSMEVPESKPLAKFWFRSPRGSARAAWGTAFLITGGTILLSGTYMYARYTRNEYALDELDDAFLSFAGIYCIALGACLLIPGFILFSKSREGGPRQRVRFGRSFE